MRKALLIFILLPLSLVAQVLRESPGQVEVSGRVIDQGAKVLPGANVVFRNLMDTTAVIKAVTDAKGTFTYNPQIEMFARFKMKSSFHKTKRII